MPDRADKRDPSVDAGATERSDTMLKSLLGERIRLLLFERRIAHLKKQGDRVGAARLYEEAEWYPEAIELYVEAEEFILAGRLYEELKEFEQAAEMFVDGGDWRRAAKLYVAAGQPAKAAGIVEAHGGQSGASKLDLDVEELAYIAELKGHRGDLAEKSGLSLEDKNAAEMVHPARQAQRSALIRGEMALRQGEAVAAARWFREGGDLWCAAELYTLIGELGLAGECYEELRQVQAAEKSPEDRDGNTDSVMNTANEKTGKGVDEPKSGERESHFISRAREKRRRRGTLH